MSDVDSPKVLWESIKARYGRADRVKEARLQTLNSEFDRLKMHETETIDIFVEIASKSASLGETIDESKLVKKLVKVVPRKFIHLVASLEQVLDLKTVGFEDVVGRLKTYEERIRGEDGGDEQRVMLTRVSSGGAGSSNGAGGGGRSSNDGWNTGGGGVSFGVSGSLSRGKRKNRGEFTRSFNGGSGSSGGRSYGGSGSGVSGSYGMKGKVGKDNNRGWVINKDGSGSGGSGSKAHNTNKPNKTSYKPKQSNNQRTIGSNQVQGNAELDRNQRHL